MTADTVTPYNKPPYHLEDDDIQDEHGIVIATVMTYDDFPCLDDEDVSEDEVVGQLEANAQFLVTAANAHADLVAALKAIDEALTKGELKFTNRRQGDSDPYHPANVLLGKALEAIQ